MDIDSKNSQVFDCEFKGFQKMKGLQINQKHTVGSCIGAGSFGRVFKLKDTKCVIKITLDFEMMATEIKVLNAMKK